MLVDRELPEVDPLVDERAPEDVEAVGERRAAGVAGGPRGILILPGLCLK